MNKDGTQKETIDVFNTLTNFVQNDRWIDGNDLKSYSKLTSESDLEARNEEDWKSIEAKAGKGRTDMIPDGATKPISLTAARKKYEIKSREVKPATKGSDIHFSNEFHAHSEVAAAADPTTQTKISARLKEAIAEIEPKSIILSYVLAINSYPNTMCMNLCRSAVQDIYKNFGNTPVDFSTTTLRASATFGTILQVTAPNAFQVAKGSTLGQFIASNDHRTPHTRGRATALEIVPKPGEVEEVSKKGGLKRKNDDNDDALITGGDDSSSVKKRRTKKYSSSSNTAPATEKRGQKRKRKTKTKSKGTSTDKRARNGTDG